MASNKRSILKTKKTANPVFYKEVKGEKSSSQYDHYEMPSSSSCIDTLLSSINQLPFDITSKQGKFAWATINNEYIPYILRDNQKFCSVQMLETGVLAKHFSKLNSGLFGFKKIKSYHPTFNEIDLMKHINEEHCDRMFGEHYSGGNDCIMKVEEALELTKFLNFCLEKIENPHANLTPDSPCGFLRLNQESIITFTVKNGEKVVPTFYFDNVDHNVNNILTISNEDWALSYLRFCCLIQGIKHDLFEGYTHINVLKLVDIKRILSTKTTYEEFWLYNPSIYKFFTRN